jgi:hypothetical protein
MATVESTTHEAPGEPGSPVLLKQRYDNFIGGAWLPPTTGEYRDNLTPRTGEPFCEIAHSGADDIELLAVAESFENGKRVPETLAGALALSAGATLRVRAVVDDRVPMVRGQSAPQEQVHAMWDELLAPHIAALLERAQSASQATAPVLVVSRPEI